MNRPRCIALALSTCLWFSAASNAEDAAGLPWIDPSGIADAVLICAGEPSASALRKAKEAAKEMELRQVRLETAAKHPQAKAEILAGAFVIAGADAETRRYVMLATVTAQPAYVGLCFAEQAALLIHGRRIEVVGEGIITIMLAACTGRPLMEVELKPGDRRDLTMLRRAAIERSRGEFPPRVAPAPIVPSGSLLINGGGNMPAEVTDKFFELAGGRDAPIVVLPIASENRLADDPSVDVRVLERAGATNIRSLRARERSEVDSPEFAAAVRAAKGVWFNGGRQWKFVDAYMGTAAEELFRDVLRRGGVIGGSSAGASIQSQYMPRGSPLGNAEMMAEGYERGLGFLPGAAVDQHFTQRQRHSDMTQLMLRWPQLLGIGLDEGTAIVVRGSRVEVIGRGTAHFYDYRAGPPAGERDFTPAIRGQGYDLVTREVIGSP